MELRRGIWYAVGAYAVWGLSPLFWNLVPEIGAIDLLVNRVIWSVPMLVLVLVVTRRWPSIGPSYASWRSKLLTVAAAVLLTINWALFLWSVTNGHVVEASLGYFINPLVSVALGVVILGERLRPLQWAAVAIAAAGVAGMTVRIGSVPWISLILAFSFGTYGLLKKRPETPTPLVSLFGESTLIAVPALIAVLFLLEPSGPALGDSLEVTTFLVSTGLITIVPLLLFGAAAKRIPLSTVGLLQYIAPTLQFLLGVFLYGEVLSQGKLIGFAIVWLALILYSYDSFRALRLTPAAVGSA